MDLKPCFNLHNLVVTSIQLNSTKLGQMTYVDVVFHMVMSIYKLNQLPAKPQNGNYLPYCSLIFNFKRAIVIYVAGHY